MIIWQGIERKWKPDSENQKRRVMIDSQSRISIGLLPVGQGEWGEWRDLDSGLSDTWIKYFKEGGWKDWDLVW